MGKGSGGGGSGFLGYRYRLTMQLAVCHGPIDAIRSVWFADKVAWQGDLRRSGDKGIVFPLSSPGLFGGEESEGGVSGHVEAGFGSQDQLLLGVNDDGTSDLEAYREAADDSPAPAWAPPRATHYRGVAVLTFLQFYIGMNPYIKDISVEVERYWRGWLPEYAKIGDDMNPAHIVYECLTNSEWGLGYEPATLNQEAFTKAALTLFEEGFGLSVIWSEQQALEDFIENINDHVDATVFLDTSTGLWTWRLIRDGDPVVAEINQDNAQMVSFKRRALGETVNELNVKWVRPETEEFVSVTIQDQASIEAQGQVVTGTREYDGVRTEALAVKLGQRDLQVVAATLAEIQVRANQTLGHLNPGDVVHLRWPDYGIGLLRCRVTETRHPDSEGSGIRIDLVEDVFGQVGNVFAGSNDTGWEDPRKPAAEFEELVFWEVPFWFVNQSVDASLLEPEATFGAMLPVTANASARAAVLYATRVLPSQVVYQERARGNPTILGVLGTALPLQFTSNLHVDPNSLTQGGDVGLDPFILIGRGPDAEIARIRGGFARSMSAQSLDRGLLDTHPKAWPVGTEVFIIGREGFLSDPQARSMGEGVGYKVTMQTSSDVTDPDDVAPKLATLTGRQGLPLPPQNIRIDGTYWPSQVEVGADNTLNVSWSTRNRLLQDSDIHVPWNGANVVSEAGVEYTVRALQNGELVDTATVMGPAAELSMLSADPGEITVEAFSEREGLSSYQVFRHTFALQKPDSGVTYDPVIVSNPGGWPLPADSSLVKVPLYTRDADPNNEVSTSGVFTPGASGRYSVRGLLEPVVEGTGAYVTGTTFRLGFGVAANGDSQSVSGVAPAGGFVLNLDAEYDLTEGVSYTLLAGQNGASTVRMTRAGLTITRLS